MRFLVEEQVNDITFYSFVDEQEIQLSPNFTNEADALEWEQLQFGGKWDGSDRRKEQKQPGKFIRRKTDKQWGIVWSNKN